MTKRSPPGARGRHISREDLALWESAAATLKPLRGAKGRVQPAPDPPAEGGPGHSPRDHPRETAGQRPAPEASYGSHGGGGVREAPQLNTFDRRAARRLKLGQAEIEARLDLHGMRQRDAHAALRRFLSACQTQGQRLVLVITGKGAPARRGEGESSAAMAGDERGILRRAVPQWLAEPQLRAIVVSFAPAAIQHGGDGALYIHLRNPERTKRGL